MAKAQSSIVREHMAQSSVAKAGAAFSTLLCLVGGCTEILLSLVPVTLAALPFADALSVTTAPQLAFFLLFSGMGAFRLAPVATLGE